MRATKSYSSQETHHGWKVRYSPPLRLHSYLHSPLGEPMPKWGKLAIYGALIAVATDYFLGPALRKNLNLH